MRHDRTLTLLHHCRDKENIYLVSKFYERKSLHHLLHEDRIELEKDEYCVLVKDICNGLVYLHNYKSQILHLDLKPKNILIDGFKEPRAVIADFGLSVMKRESQQTTIKSCGGTFAYMAPDIGSCKITDKTDIYSLSIIMWEMLYNIQPYTDLNIPAEQILLLVKTNTRPLWQDDIITVPFEIKKLIEKCWDKDPQNRPNAIQVLDEISKIHENKDLQFVPVQN